MDTLTPEERSQLMAKIRGKNTGPERKVRSLLHRAGYRFGLHRADLPGKPDIVLRKYRTVVFVHGCFWHRHKNCRTATTPRTNKAFWRKKFERNVANDKKHARALRKLGWHVVTVWECQLRTPAKIFARIERELAKRPVDLTTENPENTKNGKKNPKLVVYSLTPAAADLPLAAEKQADYRTGKTKSKQSRRHGAQSAHEKHIL